MHQRSGTFKYSCFFIISIPAHQGSKENDKTLDNMAWVEVMGAEVYEVEEGPPRFLLHAKGRDCQNI